MSNRLSRKQKRLVGELHQMFELVHLDFWNVQNSDAEDRTTRLELVMRQIVTGEVVRAFTVVDEYLNVALCHYYFGKRKSFITLWRTKKFKLFNHHVLRELHPLQKLRLVKSIRAVPSGISRDIDRLRVLRNGIAHAFFPENLRKSQPIWKGEGIFGFKGLQCFCEDMERVFDYFWQRELAGSANEPTDAGRMRSRTPECTATGCSGGERANTL